MKIVPYIIAMLMLPVKFLAAPLVGAGALEHLEELPCLRRGVSVHQESSFDRSGVNNDRNCWLYRDDLGDYVIFDDVGPGCVYRFWMTHGGAHPEYAVNYTTNHIKIYLNDDVVPRFECSIADFFSGTNAPFLAPLAGDKTVSSGGMYSYVPIPYEARCRIALTDIPSEAMRTMPWGTNTYWMYYNITYHKYASAADVESWTGMEDLSGISADLADLGNDPKNPTNAWRIAGQAELGAGASVELVSYSGTGVVNSVEFRIAHLADSMMTNVWLKIYWDGDDQPSVEAPVGEFFAVGAYSNITVSSQMMGRRSDGTFYCFFPMPFWGQARMVLENLSPFDAEAVDYSIGLSDRCYDPLSSGRFYAHFARQSYTNYVVEPDFVFLDETGRGQVVGVSFFGTGGGKIYGNGLSYLEGDERIYIDGSMTPQLHGTGWEDYFNGGWYFNKGTFTLPYHGSPVRALPFGMGVDTNYVGAYRLHLGDLIPFNQSIHMGIEHGGRDEAGCTFSSVTYYYKLGNEESGLVDCTHFDVGEPEDETVNGYCADVASIMVTNTYAYTGDDHDVYVLDTGRLSPTGSSFRVSIPIANDGVLVRRRIDSGLSYQSALVRVDGIAVGNWVFHDESYAYVDQRWRDDEFYIPCGYTTGKNSIMLSFETLPESGNWSEYAYSVYALKPFVADGDIDDDGIPDTWEVAYFGNVIECRADADEDGDGFSNLNEYICNTDPLNSESRFYFERNAEGGAFSFDTYTGRVYQVFQSTNLVQDAWVLRDVVTGSVSRVTVSLPGQTNSTVFYKVMVGIE